MLTPEEFVPEPRSRTPSWTARRIDFMLNDLRDNIRRLSTTVPPLAFHGDPSATSNNPTIRIVEHPDEMAPPPRRKLTCQQEEDAKESETLRLILEHIDQSLNPVSVQVFFKIDLHLINVNNKVSMRCTGEPTAFGLDRTNPCFFFKNCYVVDMNRMNGCSMSQENANHHHAQYVALMDQALPIIEKLRAAKDGGFLTSLWAIIKGASRKTDRVKQLMQRAEGEAEKMRRKWDRAEKLASELRTSKYMEMLDDTRRKAAKHNARIDARMAELRRI